MRTNTAGGAEALLGALGLGLGALLPQALAEPSAELCLLWFIACAPALGVFWGARGGSLFPYGLVVPVLWSLACVLQVGAGSLATPLWGLLVPSGLFAFGVGVGTLGPRWAWPASVALAALALLPLTLGLRAGLPGRPLAREAPRIASWLLDLSPATWSLESAGFDWPRNARVYRYLGVDSLPPARARFGAPAWASLRPADGGLGGGLGGGKAESGRSGLKELAAPTVLLVGCAFAVAARRVRRDDSGEGSPA